MAAEQSKPFSLQNIIQMMNDNFGLLLLGVAIFIGGVVGGSLWTQNRMLKSGAGTGQAAEQIEEAPAAPLSEADWARVQENAAFVLGEDDAPVTMVEFTDYQCPFCARHFTDTHAQLVENYVNTGKLRIVYRDQALPFHANANIAAQAVRCAEENGSGAEMHDALFASQTEWSELATEAAIAKFGEYATAAGLNSATVVSCVESGKFKEAVDADSALGLEVGAGGTPTFFIQGKPLVGAQPFSAFEAAINAELEG